MTSMQCRSIPSYLYLPDPATCQFFPLKTPRGRKAISDVRNVFQAQRREGKFVDVRAILPKCTETSRFDAGGGGGVHSQRRALFHTVFAILFAPNALCYAKQPLYVVFQSQTNNQFDLKGSMERANGLQHANVLSECQADNVAIPLYLIWNDNNDASHANTILVKKGEKRVYVFEPHGQRAKWFQSVVDAVKDFVMPRLLGLRDYELAVPETYCPYLGAQSRQVDRAGTCAAWDSIFVTNVMLNPTLPIREILQAMVARWATPTELRSTIYRYTYLVENVIQWGAQDQTENGEVLLEDTICALAKFRTELDASV